MAIHACGLIHRDLKPGNVILADDGPRIIDFGIAKSLDATALTGANAFIGSLRYMSPEQLHGWDLTPQSDVFALAALLAYAATGHSPFDAPTDPAIMNHILNDPPNLDPVTGDLSDIICACLAKKPGDRPRPSSLLERLAPAGAPREPTVVAAPERVTATVRPSVPSPEPAAEAERPVAQEQPQEGTIDTGIDVPRLSMNPPGARTQEDSPAPPRRHQPQPQPRREATPPSQRLSSAGFAPVGKWPGDLLRLLGISKDEGVEAVGFRARWAEAKARRRAARQAAEKRLMPLTWSVRAFAWLLMVVSVFLFREYYAHYTGLIVLEGMFALMGACFATFVKFARVDTAMMAFTSFCIAGVDSIFLAIHMWSPFAEVPVLLISWIFGIVATSPELDDTP